MTEEQIQAIENAGLISHDEEWDEGWVAEDEGPCMAVTWGLKKLLWEVFLYVVFVFPVFCVSVLWSIWVAFNFVLTIWNIWIHVVWEPLTGIAELNFARLIVAGMVFWLIALFVLYIRRRIRDNGTIESI